MPDSWSCVVHEIFPPHQQHLQIRILPTKFYSVAEPRESVVHPSSESPEAENLSPVVVNCLGEGLLEIVFALVLDLLQFHAPSSEILAHIVLDAVEIAHDGPDLRVGLEGRVVKFVGAAVCYYDIVACPEPFVQPLHVEHIVHDHHCLDLRLAGV